MTQPHDLTVSAAAEAIRLGRLSPVDLMAALLSRSKAMDPDLHVWVTLDEAAAMDAASASADELARVGPRGPLHGVPIGVKDIFYTANLRTTGCSPIYADFVPSYDATSVAMLRSAGAIVMGKTVTTEFACMDPSPTRNPYDHAHTPGGSSSGSAVGVAARMFPAALGSQTAGSVLRPASYNGVVGMKPTFGRISRYGVMPVAESLDTMGFFTRSVTDAAIMLGVMSGHDPSDDTSSKKPVPDYAGALAAAPRPPSIGVVSDFLDNAGPEARRHTESVIEAFGREGASIEEVPLETSLDDLIPAHVVVMAVEAAVAHSKDFAARADDYGPKVRGLIETGMAASATKYVQAQQLRKRFRDEVLQPATRYDALLTPSTTMPAPRDLTTTGDPVFQSPWTTTGLPAITIPSGLSESGLPLGIQLASAPFAEQGLLDAALWCETVLEVDLMPPLA